MGKQLLTILPGGSMVSLRAPGGKGLDLRNFGPVNVVRSSLVEWDDAAQGWYVRLLRGAMFNEVISLNVLSRAGVSCPDGAFLYGKGGKDGPLFHEEYEDAVAMEVLTIQGLRLKEGVAIC